MDYPDYLESHTFMQEDLFLLEVFEPIHDARNPFPSIYLPNCLLKL